MGVSDGVIGCGYVRVKTYINSGISSVEKHTLLHTKTSFPLDRS